MTSLINSIDETINFNKETIRIIGTFDKPLFVAKDICKILELSNVTETLRSLPEKWKQIADLSISEVSFSGGNGIRKMQKMNCITESGLYKLIMRSNKPIAQKFQEVVCEDILPTLRKKGEYKIQSIIDKNKELEEEKLRLENEKNKIEEEKKIKEEELNKKNKEIKQLHTLVKKKARKRYSYSHCVYIISNPDIKNYYKIGITGDRNQRLDALAPGAPRPYKIEYSRELQNAKEEIAIESLLLGIFDKYRVETDTKGGKQREWIENVELNILKNEMDNIVNYYQKRREYYDQQFSEEYVEENNDTDEIEEIESDDQKLDNEINEEDHKKLNEIEGYNIEFIEKDEEHEYEEEEEDKCDFKICYVCHEEKSLDDYYNRVENVDGKEGTCKKCYSNNKKVLKQEKYQREVIKREKNTKKCRTCLQIKEFTNFMKHGTSKDGYSYECNDCKLTKNTKVEQKRCVKCRVTKPIIDFNKFRLGYNKCCKKCEINEKQTDEVNEDIKKCSCCKNDLSLDNFSKSKTSSDGLYNYCKECGKIKSKQTKEKYKLQEKQKVTEKVCITCKQHKPVSYYFKCNTEKDGFQSKCKICVKVNENQIKNSLTN